jgi:tRNA(fMet)-specific endonuclease VapC
MSFVIDTDIASAFIRQIGIVQNRFLQYSGQLHYSAISLAELQFWLLRKNTPPKYRREFAVFQQQVHLVDLDAAVAQKAGEIGADLLDRGLTVATPDLLISATALLSGFTLVTHNTQDFSHIPGLKLVDWLVP